MPNFIEKLLSEFRRLQQTKEIQLSILDISSLEYVREFARISTLGQWTHLLREFLVRDSDSAMGPLNQPRPLLGFMIEEGIMDKEWISAQTPSILDGDLHKTYQAAQLDTLDDVLEILTRLLGMYRAKADRGYELEDDSEIEEIFSEIESRYL